MSEKDASDVEPGLVRLCYKYKFEDEFREPSDGWLDYIEAKCNEILGNYSKPEVEALQRAFVAWKRRRLNRVFDAVDFFYPDYPNMVLDSKNRKRKVTTKRSKVLKMQVESTPQASEEILVKRHFLFLLHYS
jgi:Trm5-related predicted tRNA methylase